MAGKRIMRAVANTATKVRKGKITSTTKGKTRRTKKKSARKKAPARRRK